MSEAPNYLECLLSELDEIYLPQRGDLLHGVIISLSPKGGVVDLGLKRDGVIPQSDLAKLPAGEANLRLNDEVAVMVIDAVDADGNLVVSIALARESGDWLKARRFLEDEEVFEAIPCGHNRGGLIIPFGSLRGFVPASHLSEMPRGLDEDGRARYLEGLAGCKMPLKVIEVDPKRRRLVLSETGWVPLKARDTVMGETPALAATSLSVTGIARHSVKPVS